MLLRLESLFNLTRLYIDGLFFYLIYECYLRPVRKAGASLISVVLKKHGQQN